MADEEDRPSSPPDGASAWGREAAAVAPGDRSGVTRTKRYVKRVTLELGGPPLALPGEAAPRSSKSSGSWPALDPMSAALELPDGVRPPRGDATEPSLPLATESDDSADGWGRSAPTPSPSLSRPRSVTPPPMPPTEIAETNDALSLVAQQGRKPVPSEPVDFRREMLERFALGDFSGALRAAEIVLGRDPSDASASESATRCREKLAQLYLARLGGGRRRLEVAVKATDVRWLGIDHRAGFLLSTIEGTATLEDVVDVSGMPRHEALKLLVELFEAGAVRLL